MRFISIRELRSGSSELWKNLKNEEFILTLNGKPIAILTGVSENHLEEILKAIRQARAILAVENLQSASLRNKTDRITAKEIEAEIQAVRKRRVS